jgi:phosphoribosylformimino-5-aminoimidazole carboxamide ribonucleotide (ProFAR) isomerase
MSRKISFTIDGWTSSNNVSFLGITAHLITNEWKLKSFLLDFIKLDGLHSGANIKEAFLKSLRSYNIESKVSFINSEII